MQSSGSEDPLLRHTDRANPNQLAHRGVDQPGRIVVPVAAAGPID
jgi:hypothetical protein